MAKKEARVVIEETEILITTATRAKLNLTYDRIKSIEVRGFKERKFLSKIPSEAIIFTVKSMECPVWLTRLQCGENYDEYKKILKKYAKEHKITFYDNAK